MGNASERRAQRVKSLLLSTISEIIRDELSDPRLGIHSITELHLSRDLSTAEVLVAAVGEPKATDDCAAALNGAAPLIWNRLRSETDLRTVPKLHFTADHSGEYSDQVFRTLEGLRESGELVVGGEEVDEVEVRDETSAG